MYDYDDFLSEAERNELEEEQENYLANMADLEIDDIMCERR